MLKRRLHILTVAGSLLVVAATACSSSKSSSAPTSTTAADATSRTTTAPGASTTTTIVRPVGPSADVTKELTGGKGSFIGASSTVDLKAQGYEQHEYVASGTATSYKAASALGADGRWTFAPDAGAPYRTRIVVRRPTDAKKFSGSVIVEWLNVSGGVDADPDWASLHEEIIREGAAYVGVSTQLIGVEGGPVLVVVKAPGVADVAGKGIKKIDPARYGSLSHPGDGFSFDMFTQVARAVRGGGALGGLMPSHVIAAGESQSAIALVTYIDGVQPLTKAFDGFFVHSRGGVFLPLVAPGKFADLAGAITGGGAKPILRTDTDVPILDTQTESDLASPLGSFAARQPDTDHFRLWEVAGTAHADRHLMGKIADSMTCGLPVNDGPMHIVAKAAWHALVEWIDHGTLPPTAPRFDVIDDKGTIKRDALGIAIGGIRTPPVDVATIVLSGVAGPNPSVICLLLGSSRSLAPAAIKAKYPTRRGYDTAFGASADAAIKAGFVIEADKPALLAYERYPV